MLHGGCTSYVEDCVLRVEHEDGALEAAVLWRARNAELGGKPAQLAVVEHDLLGVHVLQASAACVRWSARADLWGALECSRG